MLTEDCLAAFQKSSFDSFLTLYLVLNRLFYKTSDGEKRQLLLEKIHDLEKNLDYISGILYRQRLRLKDVELSRIILALQNMVDSIDIFALQRDPQSELKRLFVMKKAIGSLIVTSNGEIERLLTVIADKIAAAVVNRCKAPVFSTVDEKLRAELGRRAGYLTDEAWRSLVTAEYLYKIFVAGRTGIDEAMDYSFISILYYRALEDTLNSLIYIPYVKQLPANIKTRVGRPTKEERDLDLYISRSLRGQRSIYIKTGGKWVLPDTLMLGSMGHFLSDGAKEQVSNMIDFMARRINEKESSKALLYALGSPLRDRNNKTRQSIADRRSRAAHGGKIIGYKDVTIDKGNVYAVKGAEEYRRLLMLLLNALA